MDKAEPQPGEWCFRWVTNWEDIWNPEFLTRWKRLLSESHVRNIFFHPALCRAWLKHTEDFVRFDPRFITAESQDGGEAIFPLVCRQTGFKEAFLKMIVPLGNDYFDFHDPLVSLKSEDNALAYQDFFRQLRAFILKSEKRLWDGFELSRIRKVELPELLSGDTEVSPVGSLKPFPDFKAFVQSRKKKHRYELRKSMADLKEKGDLGLEICQPGEQDKARAWIEPLLVAREKKYGVTAITVNYLQSLIDGCLSEGILHLSRLSLNGRGIAWHFGFVDEKTLYWHIPSFDEEFHRFSPGKLHIALCIEWCFEQRVEAIDFLRGDEPYKTQWTDENQILRGLILWQTHPVSTLRRWGASLNYRLSKVKRKWVEA